MTLDKNQYCILSINGIRMRVDRLHSNVITGVNEKVFEKNARKALNKLWKEK